MDGPPAGARHRWRLRRGDVGRGFLGLAGAAVGFLITSWLLPDFEIQSVAQAFLAAALVAVIGAVLRLFLVELAVLLGARRTVRLLFEDMITRFSNLAREDTLPAPYGR